MKLMTRVLMLMIFCPCVWASDHTSWLADKAGWLQQSQSSNSVSQCGDDATHSLNDRLSAQLDCLDGRRLTGMALGQLLVSSLQPQNSMLKQTLSVDLQSNMRDDLMLSMSLRY